MKTCSSVKHIYPFLPIFFMFAHVCLSVCPKCVVLSKGQVSTRHYRFLANSGGFVWAETQATVLYNSKTSQPEAVVCLNFILRYFKKAVSS